MFVLHNLLMKSTTVETLRVRHIVSRGVRPRCEFAIKDFSFLVEELLNFGGSVTFGNHWGLVGDHRPIAFARWAGRDVSRQNRLFAVGQKAEPIRRRNSRGYLSAYSVFALAVRIRTPRHLSLLSTFRLGPLLSFSV